MTRARGLAVLAVALLAFVAAVGVALRRATAPPGAGDADAARAAAAESDALPVGRDAESAGDGTAADAAAAAAERARAAVAPDVPAGAGVPWRGRAVDAATGEPIPDVAVRLELGESAWTATTDDDGAFEVTRPPDADVRLELDHPLYVAARVAAAGFDERDWPLARAARIAGRLRGAGASPEERADARVVLWREWRIPDGELALFETGVDDEGRFAFEGLDPGAYALAARAPSSAAAARGGLVLAAGAALEVDLELERGARLVGRVYERTTRASVEGAALSARWTSAGLPLEVQEALASEARTDGAGAYELLGLSPAAVRVALTTPWDSETVRRVDVTAHGVRLEQDFAVGRLASVEGRVLDAARGSVAGAAVLLLDRDGVAAFAEAAAAGGDAVRPAGLMEVEADAGGRFLLEDVPTGAKLALAAWPPADRADELPSRLVEMKLRPEEERTGLELALEAGTPLTGTVRGPDGVPVEGAEVAVEHATGLGSLPGPRAATDADGRFAFDALVPGTARLEVAAAGFEPRTRKLKLFPRTPLDVDVLLEPAASLVVRVTDERGWAIPEASVVLWQQRADGPRGKRKLKRKERADAWGEARLDALPEGPWTVRAGAPGWELVEPVDVVVPDDAYVAVEMEPADPPRAEVVGTVRTDRDDGVPRGLRLDGLERGLVTTDGGDFRITGVRPGKRDRLVVKADRCLARTVPLDLRAGGTVDVGVVDLLAVTEVRVEVATPAGLPVRGARVLVAPDEAAKKKGKGRAKGGAKAQKRPKRYGDRVPMRLKEVKPGVYVALVLPGKWTVRASRGGKKVEERVTVRRRDRQAVKIAWKP